MSNPDRQERVFKALADPTRRAILDRLKRRPRTTGDLCGKFGSLDRCTVMQHLGVLEGAGLVIVKRDGRQRWNYLDAVPIQRIYDRWISRYAAPAADLLARLKGDLDEDETELSAQSARGR